MSEKKCLCQICTCPDRKHKCKYEEGEEALKRASEQHCRSCGCKRKHKAYVPLGPMETSTTYNSEYQPKQAEIPKSVRAPQKYDRPAAAMDGTTTYTSDFTVKPGEGCSVRKNRSTYLRPMGDMMLETTYNGEFKEKQATDRIISFKPQPYKRPMGPMNFGTTYTSDYTEKPIVGGPEPCCPCCDPKANGFLPQGMEDGHIILVKK